MMANIEKITDTVLFWILFIVVGTIERIHFFFYCCTIQPQDFFTCTNRMERQRGSHFIGIANQNTLPFSFPEDYTFEEGLE